MFYEDVFRALQDKKVRYAIAGGVAVNLHGIPRMTADLDLILDLNRENLLRFLEVMKDLGYRPRLPVDASELLDEHKRNDWITNRNLLAFTFFNQQKQFEEVDVLLEASKDSALIERCESIQVGDLSIHLISVDDLIELKRSAARQQDIADVNSLIKLKNLPEEST